MKKSLLVLFALLCTSYGRVLFAAPTPAPTQGAMESTESLAAQDQMNWGSPLAGFVLVSVAGAVLITLAVIITRLKHHEEDQKRRESHDEGVGFSSQDSGQQRQAVNIEQVSGGGDNLAYGGGDTS